MTRRRPSLRDLNGSLWFGCDHGEGCKTVTISTVLGFDQIAWPGKIADLPDALDEGMLRLITAEFDIDDWDTADAEGDDG